MGAGDKKSGCTHNQMALIPAAFLSISPFSLFLFFFRPFSFSVSLRPRPRSSFEDAVFDDTTVYHTFAHISFSQHIFEHGQKKKALYVLRQAGGRAGGWPESQRGSKHSRAFVGLNISECTFLFRFFQGAIFTRRLLGLVRRYQSTCLIYFLRFPRDPTGVGQDVWQVGMSFVFWRRGVMRYQAGVVGTRYTLWDLPREVECMRPCRGCGEFGVRMYREIDREMMGRGGWGAEYQGYFLTPSRRCEIPGFLLD